LPPTLPVLSPLSLHDALPICGELLVLPDGSIVYQHSQVHFAPTHSAEISVLNPATGAEKQIYPPKPYQPVRSAFIQRMSELYKQDRKSTRLNSSHVSISYAVF